MKILLSLIIILVVFSAAEGQESTIDESVIIEEIATDKDYGRKKKKNIKVGTVRNEYAFIAQLTGPNGEEVKAERIGSGWPVKSKNAPLGKAQLDLWEIKYEGLEKPVLLYLNGYDYEKPKCPAGLGFRKL